MDSYDFVVIGSGPGGYIAAIRAAQLKYKVAIVEKEESLGGVCLNWGCIPTKSLLTSAEVYKKVKEAESYGVKVSGKVDVDLAAIVERSRGVVEKLGSGVSMLMKKNKIEVLKGIATLLGGGNIRIEHAGKTATKKARHIILATGSSPKIIPGLSADFIWTAKDAMLFKSLPESVLVIGSGAIGMEFASFYNTIGSKVTIVEAQERILPLEDLDISTTMEKILCKRGVSILKSSQVQAITKSGSVLSAKIVDSTGKETVQKFSNALAAIGVVPNTKDLGLENTKAKLCEKGFVAIDSFCKTEEAGLYAIGDVAGPPCLAHKASHEAVICVENIAKSEGLLPEAAPALVKKNVPSCIYSIPQVASIGLTEQAAKAQNINFVTGVAEASYNGKALAVGDTDGFAKVLVCPSSGELLGAHIIGSGVTEMIASYSVSMQLEALDLDVAASVFPHPTISEMIHEATLAAMGRAH